MSKGNFAAALFIIVIAPVSMITWAVSVEKKSPVKTAQVSDEVSALNYNAFIRMDVDEMEETKGKVGPIIGGAITGATLGIVGAYANAPGHSPSNVNIIAGATGGAVGGALYPVIGAVGSGVIGIAVASGINETFGGDIGGGNCYSSGCHEVYK